MIWAMYVSILGTVSVLAKLVLCLAIDIVCALIFPVVLHTYVFLWFSLIRSHL